MDGKDRCDLPDLYIVLNQVSKVLGACTGKRLLRPRRTTQIAIKIATIRKVHNIRFTGVRADKTKIKESLAKPSTRIESIWLA